MRHVLWLTATYELVVLLFIMISSRNSAKGLVIAITGAQFLLYRICKALLGDMSPCPCLGSVPRSLGLSDSFADWLLIGIASYFLCGGVLSLRPPVERAPVVR
jgi:hypothetical protein